MALYMPAARRRRRLILALLAALIVGGVVGGFTGRNLAPSLGDRVGDVQDQARAVTSELRAMPINYEKERAGGAEFRRGGGVADALDRAHSDLRSALDAAPWPDRRPGRGRRGVRQWRRPPADPCARPVRRGRAAVGPTASTSFRHRRRARPSRPSHPSPDRPDPSHRPDPPTGEQPSHPRPVPCRRRHGGRGRRTRGSRRLGSGGDPAVPTAGSIATLTDGGRSTDRSEVPAGEVTFDMENDGGVTHEFVVVKTDLAPEQLPVDDDGMFDERGAGLTFVDEVEDVDPGGGTAKLTVDLEPGKYLLVCNKPPVPKENLPAHWAEKMYTPFTVTG